MYAARKAPLQYRLYMNAPRPFNFICCEPSTHIAYLQFEGKKEANLHTNEVGSPKITFHQSWSLYNNRLLFSNWVSFLPSNLLHLNTELDNFINL